MWGFSQAAEHDGRALEAGEPDHCGEPALDRLGDVRGRPRNEAKRGIGQRHGQPVVDELQEEEGRAVGRLKEGAVELPEEGTSVPQRRLDAQALGQARKHRRALLSCPRLQQEPRAADRHGCRGQEEGCVVVHRPAVSVEDGGKHLRELPDGGGVSGDEEASVAWRDSRGCCKDGKGPLRPARLQEPGQGAAVKGDVQREVGEGPESAVDGERVGHVAPRRQAIGCTPLGALSGAKRFYNSTVNSLAQHWARDWREKNFTTQLPRKNFNPNSLARH